jgi:hypothetical protein
MRLAPSVTEWESDCLENRTYCLSQSFWERGGQNLTDFLSASDEILQRQIVALEFGSL